MSDAHKTEIVQEGNDRYLRCSCGTSLSTYNQADRHIERAKADRLRDAARPFVDAFLGASYPDQDDENIACPPSITVGDYRRLWAAMEDDQ